MKRLFSAWVDACTAGMERFAAEMNEFTKNIEDREYSRGYSDAIHDFNDARAAQNGDET